MSAFYSIVKISTNPVIGDTTSVGLILFTGQKIWFHYDQVLLTYLKPILQQEYDGVVKILKMMERKISTLDTGQLDLYNQTQRYFEKSFYKKIATEEPGLIQLTMPNPINIPADHEQGYHSLFKSIVGNWTKQRKNTDHPEKRIIRDQLLRPLKNQITYYFSFDKSMIPELYFHFPFEGAGSNGEMNFVVKYLDFGQTPPTLERKTMRLFYLLDAYHTKDLPPLECLLIGKIPEPRKRSKFRLYNLLIERSEITFYHIEDVLQLLKRLTILELSPL